MNEHLRVSRRDRQTIWPLLFSLLGCSSTSASAPADGTSNSEFKHDIVLTMGLVVPAFTELHQCQFAVLPIGADVDATSFSHEYTAGSHHFLVIATDLDAVPPDMQGQYDCTYGNEAIMAHARAVIYGGQTPTGHFPLPADVGFRLTARQVVIMQTHYLNGTDKPIQATVRFGVDTVAAGTLHQQAGMMFFYDPFIYVPAQGTASSGIRCAVPDAVQIISASSHYHQRGTGMSVFIDQPGSPAAAPFFETHDWEHPVDFHGPFVIPAGSVVRVRCAYSNPDSQDVFEGPNAKTSEMCVFGGLYYPKRSAAFDACQNLSVVGTGTATCSDLVTCYRGCSAGQDGGVSGDLRECREKCITAGCPGAADALLKLVLCAQPLCGQVCKTASADCDACLQAQCPSELGACSQACPP